MCNERGGGGEKRVKEQAKGKVNGEVVKARGEVKGKGGALW